MTDARLEAYHYEVVDGARGRSIYQNTESEGGAVRVLAEGGIKFPHEGPDANLWLGRRGMKNVRFLAQRRGGRVICIERAIRSIDPLLGAHIEAGNFFLRPGDQFVIAGLDFECQPGPIDADEPEFSSLVRITRVENPAA